MEYRILGKLEVLRDGESVDLGAFRQRSMLAMLLTSPNTVFSTDQLIDGLWGDDGSVDRQNSLWVYVSGLRKALEPEREKRSDGNILLTRSPGYLLEADPDEIDAVRFERMIAEARSLADTDPAAASLVYGEALALWRGKALEEFTYESFAQAEIARLEGLRLEAVEGRIDADLDRGMSRELVSELETLVRQHPLQERLTGQLMLAMYRSGRQADALRVYQQLSSRLGEELGVAPSNAIRRLEEQIVTGDLALDSRTSSTLPGSGPATGLVVRGYELREELGEGSFGVVYRAYQPAVGREVAIKVIRPELANDPDFIRRFEAEAQAVARLEHPHIVPLYDYWREPDAAYLVMRLMKGGNLAELLEASALAPGQANHVVEQLGSALQAAHRSGVPHRKLTSDNILLDEEGNAYLSDFGIAARLDDKTDVDVPDLDAFVAEMREAFGIEEVTPIVTRIELDNPYKGLRSFDGADSAHFFGRDRLIERLVARLGKTGPRGRFVAVVGPSGSGKSSVVKAGLLPALRRGALPGSDGWFTVTMTPAPHPFEELEDALRGIAINPPTSLLEQISSENGLQRAVRRVLPDDGSQLLLVIDQFEELFTQVDAETAQGFLDALASAANDEHGRVRVVATLRADFYDRPLRHRGLGELVRECTEAITPMTPAELERAITGPVESLGVSFEPALVAELVRDVVDRAGALPLLQYTLTELFDARQGQRITHRAYSELGGVSGAIVERAEGLLARLGEDAHDTTRQVFLRLVTLGEGADDTRRRVLRSELEQLSVSRQVLDGVLDIFGRHRLLSFDRDPVTRGPTVEIAHEALLTEWTRLRNWIDGARHDVRNQRRLADAMGEWAGADHADTYLLHGGRLEQLHGWATTSSLPLSAPEQAFLDASIAERDRVETEERDREKRAVDAELEAKHRSRQLTGAAIAGLLVAMLAVFGVVQWRSAEAAKADSDHLVLSAELATSSGLVLDDDPELALLLGAAAVRETAALGYATEDSVDSIHWALQRLGVQYPVGSEAAFAVRSGPAGLAGVFVMRPAELVALAEGATERRLTNEDCLAAIDRSCPELQSVPPDTPLRFGVDNYGVVIPEVLPDAPSFDAGPLAGTRVSFAASSALNQADGLEAELEHFTELTGIEVTVVRNDDFQTMLALQSGDVALLPDIATNYYLPAAWAEPRTIDLSQFLDVELLRSDFGDYLIDLSITHVDGQTKLQTIPATLIPKGVVFYAKPTFDTAGYTIPETWDDMMTLSTQMVADGFTPFCFQWEAGFASGFPGSDFFEAVLLRDAGVEVYDGVISGETSFASPEVLEAAEAANELLFAPGFVRGGTDSISRENFLTILPHMAETDPLTGEPGPQCLMTISQPEMTQQLIPGSELGVDIDVFPLPPIDPTGPALVNGGGTLAYGFSDRPEVRALLQYLSSPEWGEVWAVEPGTVDPFFSANKRFDTTIYQADRSAADYDVRVRIHEISHAALETETWRWDLSDLLPLEIGAWTSEFQPGPLWQGMLDWADGAKPIAEILVDLEQTRRDLGLEGGGAGSG